MIVKPKTNNILSNFPFFAKVDRDKNEISFSEGFIIDIDNPIYDNARHADKEDGFSIGRMVRPSNMDKTFKLAKGKKFYVNVTKDELGFAHTSKIEESDADGSGFLIWEDFNKDISSSQIITENIINSNPDYELHGFDINIVAEEKDGKRVYKVNGGYIFLFPMFEFRYLDDFEFEVAKGESVNVSIKVKIKPEGSIRKAKVFAEGSQLSDFYVWMSDIPRVTSAKLTTKTVVGENLTIGKEGAISGGTYKIQVGSVNDFSKEQNYRGNIMFSLTQKGFGNVGPLFYSDSFWIGVAS